MALVICCVELTDAILFLTSFKLAILCLVSWGVVPVASYVATFF